MCFLKSEFPDQDMELTAATNLLDEWFIDSLWLIETIMYLEKEFDIKLGRADLNGNNFENIDTLSEFILSRLAK